jgi:hypothetical protein
MAETVSANQQSAFTNPQAGQRPIASASVRDNDNALRVKHNAHDADGGVHFQSSALASRPAFGTAGRKWLTTDGLRIYYDTGSAWSEVDYLSKTAGGTVAGNTTFSGTLTGTLTGNAGTATALATARDFSISGDITASTVSFNGTGAVVLSAAITAGSIVNADINASAAIVDTKLAQLTTAGKVANSATTGTAAATGSTLVLRDANGDAAFRYLTLNGVAYVFPGADGTSGQVLQTNGSGTLSWAAAAAGFITGSGTTGKITKFNGAAAVTDSIMTEASTQINVAGTVRLANNSPLYGRNQANNADIEIARVQTDNAVAIGATTATVYIAPTGGVSVGSLTVANGSFTLPSADGSSGQVMQTNGSGTVTWATPAAGLSGLTTGTIPKAASASTLGNSIITESGTTITVSNIVNAVTQFNVNGTQVVAARSTGWGPTFTQSASKTATLTGINVAPSAIEDAAPLVPVMALEGLVRAMYDAMTSHGLIGA